MFYGLPVWGFGVPKWNLALGEENAFYKTLVHCRKAGVRFISFPTLIDWNADAGDEVWGDIDSVMRKIIEIHPEALIIPRCDMNPPQEMIAAHPEWRMKFADGKPSNIASVFCEEYRQLASARLEKLVRHLRKTFPHNFAGVHPSAQSFGEFFYIDSLCERIHGREECELAAYRQWLLRHGLPNAGETAVPSAEAIASHSNGLLRDPVKELNVILFAQFEQEGMADFIAQLAAAARRGGDGKTLSMFFYGYGYEHVHAPNGPSATGTYGLERLLRRAAKDIDILCGPVSYIKRSYPATASAQSAADSVMRHGVMWIDEDDTRTYLAENNEWATAGGWTPIGKDETIRQLRANLTSEIMRGRGCWWMDLIGQGWYDDRDLWRVMEELKPLDEKMLARKQPYSPEIAFLIDERSLMFAAAGAGPALEDLIKYPRDALERCGVTYGQYFASDAFNGTLTAKLQIFTSSYFISPAMRERIVRQRQLQNDITRVWCWAPGYLTMRKKSEENIFLSTGFQVRRISPAVPAVTATAAGLRLGMPQSWAGRIETDPLFAVEATDAETLARWPDGSPAVAMRHSGNGYEVFYGIPSLPLEVITAFANLAGCKRIAEPGAAIVNEAEGLVSVQPFDDFGRPNTNIIMKTGNNHKKATKK